MEIHYNDINEINKLYTKLQDDLSKQIFFERLKCDISPSMSNIFQLFSCSGYLTEDEIEYQYKWKDCLVGLTKDNKKIILY